MICARNEEQVIGNLLDSIAGQDYPKDKLHVFVIADNCTDETAAIARAKGATVYERHDLSKARKGYALEFGFKRSRKITASKISKDISFSTRTTFCAPITSPK